MRIADLLPADALVAARLLRTRATMAGWRDPDERRHRLETVARIVAHAAGPATGRRVLVFSFRGWYPHAAWDAVLAHALRLRGADVHVFNCGGRMPACEVNFRHASSRLACTECALYPSELVREFQLPRSWLRDYVQASEARTIDETVRALAAEDLPRWTYEGVPVGELARASVLWLLRKSTIDLSGNDARIYRNLLIAAAQVVLLTPRLLAAHRPDVTLQVNGQFFAERIFNHLASGCTRVVAYEAGWRSNTLGFDVVTDRGPVDLDAVWADCVDRPLTAAERAELDAWVDSRSAGHMERDFYVRFQAAGGDPIAALGLRPDLPTAVMFTNIVWDTAVQGRELGFASIHDWVRQTVEYFRQRPGFQLAIRIHPAEDLRPSQESAEKLSDLLAAMKPLPANVRVVASRDGVSSYDLMRRGAVTLVYTSTAGLEAALHGREVVVAGRVYFGNRGFTSDVDDSARYAACLDRAFESGGLSEDGLERARRFAHLLMFRYLHRVPVVRQRPGTLPLLAPDDTDLLLPGRLPAFDDLMQAIADGERFVDRSAASAQVRDLP